MAAPEPRTYGHADRHLQYGGEWEGTHNTTAGALSTSNDPSANVTITFPSGAISFKYFGTRTRFGICLDCDFNNPHFVLNGSVGQTDEGPTLLYSEQFAQPGISGVAIQNVPNSGPPNAPSPITVGHFEIVPANVPQPRKAPIGAIVGGAVGGAGGLLVIGAIIFYFWWQRKSRRRVSEYIVESGFQLTSTTRKPPKPTPMTQMRSTAPVTDRKSGIPENARLQALSSPPSSVLPSSSRPETNRREIDAGPVDHDSSNNTGDQVLPPDYEHVFQNARGGSTEVTGSSQRRKR